MPYFQQGPTYLSRHNSKLNPTPMTLLCINPVWGLDKEKHIIHTTIKVPAILMFGMTQVYLVPQWDKTNI